MIPLPMMRLDKLISNSGLIPRSQVKRLVREGRITVNGVIAGDAAMHCDSEWDIRVDGVKAIWRDSVCLMMNKPVGYLSVTEDPDRATVLDLLSEKYRRCGLFPAGRLDMDSQGLLILTNDGAFCHRVISPKSGIVKEYRIQVSHPFPAGAERQFREGIRLDDGSLCLPAELIPDADRLGATVRIREGKYHQVKRMALAVGTRVRSLKRISIGTLRLDPALAPGEYRELTDEEKRAVEQQSDTNPKVGPVDDGE